MKNYFDFLKESTRATIRRHKAGVLTPEQREKFIKRQQGKIAKIDKEGRLSARASQIRDTIKAVSESQKLEERIVDERDFFQATKNLITGKGFKTNREVIYDRLEKKSKKKEKSQVKESKEDMPCNKPRASTSAGKKMMVKACEGGQEKIVHFGAKGYGHNYSPAARKSFRARHKCGEKKSKLGAQYWACRKLWAGPKGSKKSCPPGRKCKY